MDEVYNESIATLDGAIEKYKPKSRVPTKALMIGGGVAAAMLAGGYALVGTQDAASEYVPGEFIVEFEEGFEPSDMESLNDRLEGETYEHLFDNWYLVDIDDSLNLNTWMDRYEDAEGIEYVQENAIVTLDYIIPELSDEQLAELEDIVNGKIPPNDPLYHSEGSWKQPYNDLYGLHNTDAAEAWEITTGSNAIKVAVVDTGVDYNHEDLVGAVIEGWDFVNNDNDAMDDQGHGTHVAGTIRANANNNLGIVGADWNALIVPVKVLNSRGSGSFADVAAGIAWAGEHADVINMSLGGPAGSNQKVVDEAIDHAIEHDTIIVVAAGNSNGDTMRHTPANNPHVIAVGATDYRDAKASFSNWGEKVDVSAPGVGILSTLASDHKFGNRIPIVGEHYGVLQGTSMACPHVAGDVSLILAANPDLKGDVEAVRAVVRAGVDEWGSEDDDGNTIPIPPKPIGTGRINYAEAVLEAQK